MESLESKERRRGRQQALVGAYDPSIVLLKMLPFGAIILPLWIGMLSLLLTATFSSLLLDVVPIM
jgi:hypothetical protein